MRRRGRLPEQLDIPLVWDLEGGPDAAPPPVREVSPQPTGGAPATGWGRLVPAAAADAGVVLVFCVATGFVALLAGAALNPGQLVAVAIAGAVTASATSAAVVWAWRGTIGMLLMGVGFTSPLGFARAAGLWALWGMCLPLAGVPLVLGRGVLERLARSQLRCR